MLTPADVMKLAMAAVLLVAGLEKARRPATLPSVLRELGLPRRAAWVVGFLVTGLELTAAFGLLYRPTSPGTLVLVVLLSSAFAVAGLVALNRDYAIHCACFGVTSRGRLGLAQLTTMPLWWMGVAVLWRFPDASLLDGAVGLMTVGLVLATARGAMAWKPFLAARADRRSASEMYAWIR